MVQLQLQAQDQRDVQPLAGNLRPHGVLESEIELLGLLRVPRDAGDEPPRRPHEGLVPRCAVLPPPPPRPAQNRGDHPGIGGHPTELRGRRLCGSTQQDGGLGIRVEAEEGVRPHVPQSDAHFRRERRPQRSQGGADKQHVGDVVNAVLLTPAGHPAGVQYLVLTYD